MVKTHLDAEAGSSFYCIRFDRMCENHNLSILLDPADEDEASS